MNLCPDLTSLKSFSTDGEKALYLMGHTSSGVRELGLVDADDKDDFAAKLNSL